MKKINGKLIIFLSFIGLATSGLAGAGVGIGAEFYVYIGPVVFFLFFIFAIFSNKERIKEYAFKLSSLLFLYKFNCFLSQ
jgi:hypothetical protein